MAAPVSVVRSPAGSIRGQGHSGALRLVADEDGHRHGAAHGDHVDDTGEVERRLMRRDGFCAEFRDEDDDEAEEARFHEDTERIRDAECHVLFPDEEAAFW